VSSITWTPTATEFAENTAYSVEVKAAAGSNYVFKTGAPVKIGEHTIEAPVISADGKTLTATYPFAKTGKKIIKTITITGLTNPAIGGTPVTKEDISISESDTVVKESLTWSPSTAKFEADKTYTASLSFVPKDTEKYQFANAVTVTVNGEAATGIVAETKDKVSVVCSFAKLSYKDITNATVSGLTPQIGKVPSYSPNVETTPSGGVASPATNAAQWEMDKGVFEADKPYKVTVTLSPKTGYRFTSSTNVLIDGTNQPHQKWMTMEDLLRYTHSQKVLQPLMTK
jgi:hypothetical protein